MDMPPHCRSPLGRTRRLCAVALLAGGAAHAQFATVPVPEARAELRVSTAVTEKAYRQDAARHIYAAYPSRIYRGMLPPLLHAVIVTETDVDAFGVVRRVRVVREPASAKEVVPWVVGLIRRASPLPPPRGLGTVRYTETWLVDKTGRFQVHSLTEGQR